MTKRLSEYRGVILLIVTIVVTLNFYTSRVKELNNMHTTNSTIAYYEK